VYLYLRGIDDEIKHLLPGLIKNIHNRMVPLGEVQAKQFFKLWRYIKDFVEESFHI
jgi:hypothetical protein